MPIHSTHLPGSGRHAVEAPGGDDNVNDRLPLGEGLSDHLFVYPRYMGLRNGDSHGSRDGVGRRGKKAYSLVACLSPLTINHASLFFFFFFSRRSTVPTPNRDTSNTLALITLLPYITEKLFVFDRAEGGRGSKQNGEYTRTVDVRENIARGTKRVGLFLLFGTIERSIYCRRCCQLISRAHIYMLSIFGRGTKPSESEETIVNI